MADTIHAEVLVLGGGPGGYTAAFRAADLGKQVVLVEKYPVLGGVCLNVGCIPSKALLHVAQIVHEAEHFEQHGLSFGKPEFDLDKIRDWKEGITKTLTGGLARLAKQRKVKVVQGLGQFTGANSLDVVSETGTQKITFENAIIAAGSQVNKIPVFPNDDPRLMDSTDALNMQDVPKKLLIVGGGIIGLEMATVYHALGSEISVVELMDQIIPGCDKDLVTPLQRHIKKQYKNIWLKTKVESIVPQDDGLKVTFGGDKAPEPEVFEKVLVAIGRKPNGLL
ncbi:MAG: NAD(P)/FAD-dependent oxidoreductase, partial [Methyloprofundus sp.]